MTQPGSQTLLRFSPYAHDVVKWERWMRRRCRARREARQRLRADVRSGAITDGEAGRLLSQYMALFEAGR